METPPQEAHLERLPEAIMGSVQMAQRELQTTPRITFVHPHLQYPVTIIFPPMEDQEVITPIRSKIGYRLNLKGALAIQAW